MNNPEDILAGLDPEQLHVAQSLQGPVCIIAGAGTGKTRAITHRIAYGVSSGVYTPSSVLALTFTARAAAEMHTRLRQLGATGVQARTFHAAALRQVQYFWPEAVGGVAPTVLGHKANLITEAARRLRLTVDRAVIRDLASEIEWAKVSMLSPESYAEHSLGREIPGNLDVRGFARLFQVYEDLKSDRNVLDFEDVLLVAVGIIEENDAVATAVRKQYRHFVVDEYQDVSPLQHRLLSLWLGGREELCVVGDASQTIYSFTGARSDYLMNFSSEYPKASVIKLVRDYRSTEQVVKTANILLSSRVIDPAYRHGKQPAWSQPLELHAQGGSGAEPVFLNLPDDDSEAKEITSKISQLISEGIPAQEIAVLYRTNGQSEPLEAALSDAGIPYQLRGAERFFSRPEIRQSMAHLKSVAVTTPDMPLSAETVAELLNGYGYSSTPPPSKGAMREKWESLSALVALAAELTVENSSMTISEFSHELMQRSQSQHAPGAQGVSLASLHSAKGLEWEAVFLAGMSEGLMPISFVKDQAGLDEERRLLYVGITRAKSRLYFSYAKSRTAGVKGTRQRSRFLDPLAPRAAHQPSTATAAPKGNKESKTRLFTHCRSCQEPLNTAAQRKIGRCSNCPPSYSEQTLETFKKWRKQTADSQGVPAFVVFTDATLNAIVELRPQTLAELAQVSGVGATKLEHYGEQVLTLVRSAAPEPREPVAADNHNQLGE